MGQRGGIPRYLFEVIDTGPGISPERQAAMFEPFEQGEAGVLKEGTGLGLTIARRHVALMGGEFRLVSEPGRGATFSFTLCLPEASARREGWIDRWDRVVRLAPGCAVEALVVDDIPESREVLAEMLGRIGVVVRTAGGGPEALERVRARTPDIVFMDIHMPGMDGVEAMRRIAQTYDRERVKVAAISASVLTHEQEQYLSAGFHAFLDKPIRVGRLYACLAELLGATFEYDEATPADAPPPDPGGRVALPEGLAQRLRRAAEMYQVTELRRCLQEAESLGPPGQGFAGRLRALVEKFDMEGVLRLVEGDREA